MVGVDTKYEYWLEMEVYSNHYIALGMRWLIDWWLCEFSLTDKYTTSVTCTAISFENELHE